MLDEDDLELFNTVKTLRADNRNKQLFVTLLQEEKQRLIKK